MLKSEVLVRSDTTKGEAMCINGSCGNAVDFGSIEVMGEGFVCSLECEAAMSGASADWYEDIYCP